jgi:hypothetical protein
MRLRARITDELKTRLTASLPEAMETVWDTQAVLVMVESLSFKPASGFEGEWARRTSFDGVIRAELRSDKIDDLEAELLIASLLTEPMIIKLPEGEALDGEEPDAHHCKARLELADWRDAVRDQMVVAALRFKAGGTLCAYSPDPGRPHAGIAGGFEPRLIEGDAP